MAFASESHEKSDRLVFTSSDYTVLKTEGYTLKGHRSSTQNIIYPTKTESRLESHLPSYPRITRSPGRSYQLEHLLLLARPRISKSYTRVLSSCPGHRIPRFLTPLRRPVRPLRHVCRSHMHQADGAREAHHCIRSPRIHRRG